MAADEMYFYLDDTAQQKGPLPRRALLKLLESGLVSRATYVWRHGADAGATAYNFDAIHLTGWSSLQARCGSRCARAASMKISNTSFHSLRLPSP